MLVEEIYKYVILYWHRNGLLIRDKTIVISLPLSREVKEVACFLFFKVTNFLCCNSRLVNVKNSKDLMTAFFISRTSFCPALLTAVFLHLIYTIINNKLFYYRKTVHNIFFSSDFLIGDVVNQTWDAVT